MVISPLGEVADLGVLNVSLAQLPQITVSPVDATFQCSQGKVCDLDHYREEEIVDKQVAP